MSWDVPRKGEFESGREPLPEPWGTSSLTYCGQKMTFASAGGMAKALGIQITGAHGDQNLLQLFQRHYGSTARVTGERGKGIHINVGCVAFIRPGPALTPYSTLIPTAKQEKARWAFREAAKGCIKGKCK